MNRLANKTTKFPFNQYHYNFLKLDYSFSDKEARALLPQIRERRLVSVSVNDSTYIRAIEILAFCNPTDYESYKAWIVYWKQLYKKLTFDIRAAKLHWKQCLRTERSFQMSDYMIKQLKEIAKTFLRIRQQMKMFNRYYMQARKEGTNV
jgi:hypothetical protein